MEKPGLKPRQPRQSGGAGRWGLLLINLPWLFVLVVLWWLWAHAA